MATKRILQIESDEKILRQKCVNITNFSEAVKIAKDLVDTLNASKIPGAGLSAPQIGINKNIFVARKFYNEQDNNSKYIDFIVVNPNLKNKSKEKIESLEACLSIFDVYGFVQRYKKIGIEYFDLKGQKQLLKTGGFFSNVLQHEMDHLRGILFTDKLINNKAYTEKQIDTMYANENKTVE